MIIIVLTATILGGVALWLANRELDPHEYRQESLLEHSADKASGMLSLQEILLHLNLPDDIRVLEVEREQQEQKMVYEIELLMPDGHVKEIFVDPLTAQIIDSKEGHEELHETATGRR